MEKIKKIAIIGAGGLGREVCCIIKAINDVKPTWEIIGFFDDSKPIGSKNEYGEILGKVSDINNFNEPLSVVIAIANGEIIEKIVSKITSSNIVYPNIIHPTVKIVDYNNYIIGQGNIIAANSLISCNVSLGSFNLYNGYITIGHDTTIGSYNIIMPGVRISGEIEIGNHNFFGTNSVVIQQLRIGNHVKIGAGSVVIRKTIDNNLYIGNPAIKMKL